MHIWHASSTKPLSISVNLFNHYENKVKKQPRKLTYIYKITLNIQNTPMDYWAKRTVLTSQYNINSGDTEKFTVPTLEMQSKTIVIHFYPTNPLRDSQLQVSSIKLWLVLTAKGFWRATWLYISNYDTRVRRR